MNNYEAMFIIKPELPEEEKKTLFAQIAEAITKHGGEGSFSFPLKSTSRVSIILWFLLYRL
jgi:ribosomal protein S6